MNTKGVEDGMKRCPDCEEVIIMHKGGGEECGCTRRCKLPSAPVESPTPHYWKYDIGASNARQSEFMRSCPDNYGGSAEDAEELPPRPETYTDRHTERIKPGEDAAAVRYIAALEARLRAVPVEERTATSGNYVADREQAPEWVCFANGRTVAIAYPEGRRPHLVVDWEKEGEKWLRTAAAAEDDAGCINIGDASGVLIEALITAPIPEERTAEMEQRADLLARFLEARAWSVFDSQDPEIIRLRQIENRVYAQHRDKDFMRARIESMKAVVLAVIGDHIEGKAKAESQEVKE